MENENFKFRPGLEYNCYLPRLSGADAIPTLTPKKYRQSCSALCSHSWKPREAPRIPTPPPPDPMVLYQRRYLREQIEDWDFEIDAIEKELRALEMNDEQGEEWKKARETEQEIERINRSGQRITKHYQKDLFDKLHVNQEKDNQREKIADEKLKELDAIRCENSKLEEQLRHLVNYERIGDARDKIKIEKMRKKLENHKRAVQHELDHPPFVAPKIVEPELPQLPSPRENIWLREEISRISAINAAERADLSKTRESVAAMKKEIASRRVEIDLPSTIGLRKLPESTLEHFEIPVLSVPMHSDQFHF